MVASPQYGGMCHSIFARSLGDLQFLAGHYGLALDVYLLCSESLITRARNVCVDGFLGTKGDHLIFIDADIGFDADDVIELLILQIQNPQYEVIGGRYRRKQMDGGWVFNSRGKIDDNVQEPVEVDGIGTGFMMINRGVFAKFNRAFPQYTYKSDYPGGQHEELMQYFQAEIDPKSGRYLSEDYWFSLRCQEIGIKTWLCPWMKLRHAGAYIYE